MGAGLLRGADSRRIQYAGAFEPTMRNERGALGSGPTPCGPVLRDSCSAVDEVATQFYAPVICAYISGINPNATRCGTGAGRQDTGKTDDWNLRRFRIPSIVRSIDHAPRISIGRGGSKSIHPPVDACRTCHGCDCLESTGTWTRRYLCLCEQSSHHPLDFVLVCGPGDLEPGGDAVNCAASRMQTANFRKTL